MLRYSRFSSRVSVQGSLSKGGLCLGSLCLGCLWPGGSLSGGSLSRGSLSGGLCQGDPPYGNVRAVRMLLECILVCKLGRVFDQRNFGVLFSIREEWNTKFAGGSWIRNLLGYCAKRNLRSYDFKLICIELICIFLGVFRVLRHPICFVEKWKPNFPNPSNKLPSRQVLWFGFQVNLVLEGVTFHWQICS